MSTDKNDGFPLFPQSYCSPLSPPFPRTSSSTETDLVVHTAPHLDRILIRGLIQPLPRGLLFGANVLHLVLVPRQRHPAARVLVIRVDLGRRLEDGKIRIDLGRGLEDGKIQKMILTNFD